MKMEIVKGNILNVKASALVLPANTGLHEGSGVSTAIFEASGRKELTEACRKLGGCEEGKAVATLAFDLDADYIIHAVVPKWEDGQHGEYERLCTAYLAGLKVADVMGIKSVAFPLLGSGNNGYDLEIALEIAVKSIGQFEGDNLKTVYLVIYGNRISKLVSEKGYEFSVVPDEYVAIKKEKKKVTNTDALKIGLAKAGKVFANKENWMNMLEVAGAIVGLAVQIKKFTDGK